MALINCPECGKEISDSSKVCINCGYKIKKKKNKKPNIGVILFGILDVVLVIIAIVVVMNAINKDKVGGETFTKITTTASSTDSQKQVGFEEDKQKITTFNKNSKIVTDACEFTLTGYVIQNKIEPANPDGYYYSYFEAGSGNVYVDVKFTIKNTNNSEIKQADILDSVKIIYDGNYEYKCSFVTVDKNGDFENYTTLYGINPLETMEYHMLAEVPSEVKTSSKGLVVQVEVDGHTYKCTLR